MTDKITEFGKPTCKRIGAELEAGLKELGERLGLKITYAGGMIDDLAFTAKLRCEMADGEAKALAEKAAFVKHCDIFGLRPEDYGTEFAMRGERYRLTGFALGRSTRPLAIVRLSDDRPLICGTEIVPLIRSMTDARSADSAAA